MYILSFNGIGTVLIRDGNPNPQFKWLIFTTFLELKKIFS